MDTSDQNRMVDELAEYVRQKTEKFESSLESAVATGDAEAIHGLRVTSRRLDEPLWILAPCLPRREVKRARRGLKRMRRAFRKVRDLDVFIHSLASAPASPAREDLAELESQVSTQRAAALTDAVRRIRNLDPPATLKALGGIARASSSLDEREEWLATRLERRLNRLAHALVECDPQDKDRIDLHAARIRVKRLRYGVELADSLGVRSPPRLAEMLISMQDSLGRWNDDITAGSRLARMADRDGLLARRAECGARLLEYAASRARCAAAQREKIIAAWSGLSALIEESFNTNGGADPLLDADAVKDEPVHV